MIARLGRRALEAGVGLFALLGFAFVPLGERTALEHAGNVFSTPAAREAGRELIAAGVRLRQRILEVFAGEPHRPRRSPAGAGEAEPLLIPVNADAGVRDALPDASLVEIPRS